MRDITKERFSTKLTHDGRIPKGTVCPWVDKCPLKDERCPEIRREDFSCATARGFDICER